jgi:hypothetical protein
MLSAAIAGRAAPAAAIATTSVTASQTATTDRPRREAPSAN